MAMTPKCHQPLASIHLAGRRPPLVLLHEAEEIETRLRHGSNVEWYSDQLDNSIYLPLVRQVAKMCRLWPPRCPQVP
jgi:hypothetical protein